MKLLEQLLKDKNSKLIVDSKTGLPWVPPKEKDKQDEHRLPIYVPELPRYTPKNPEKDKPKRGIIIIDPDDDDCTVDYTI